MSCSGEFEGSIFVDGRERSRGVGLWLSENNLVLKEVGRPGLCRFNIYLHPFSELMILTLDPECMKDGLFFDIRGNNVGLVSDGPLGHPGDGEFNNRKILAFRTTVTYSADRVEVDIDGQTASGVDAYNANKVLPAGKFAVRFAIPKERVADFFHLNEGAHANLHRAFAKAFP